MSSAAGSPQVTAVVLTLNEAAHIGDCLATLAWADRQLVFDSFSSDGTVELAAAAGAEVVQSPFENYAQQRNAALECVQTGWVFFVDADERATPELAAEIGQVTAARPEAGWRVPRHNIIFGRLTRGAGWYPDYQLRLFRHGRVRYERPVHEIAVVDGVVGTLTNPLVHHNYRDLAHFRAKQARYTSYDAALLQEQGMRPGRLTFAGQSLRQFWWRFVTLKGYRDGRHGLKLSLLMATYEWVKYRKLAALWRQAL